MQYLKIKENSKPVTTGYYTPAYVPQKKRKSCDANSTESQSFNPATAAAASTWRIGSSNVVPVPPKLGRRRSGYSRGPVPSRDMRDVDTDCSKYTTTADDMTGIRRLVGRHGFAIVEDALSKEQCRDVIDGIWDSMEKITSGLKTPLKRNDSRTWPSIKQQSHMHNIYTDHGIVHAEFMWRLRQNEKIMRVFSDLYACKPEDLLVSYDGVSVQTPPENGNRGGWYKNCWYHVDQSYTRPEKECFQSWVTGIDVNPGDYTISFFVDSHHSFKDFGEYFNITNRGDFFKLKTQEQMQFYESRHDQIRITCKAGSMVVWDSRLLHSGLEPLKDRETPNTRMVCFLSYSPRQGVPQWVLLKRRRLFETRRATTHWSGAHMKTAPSMMLKRDSDGYSLKTLRSRPKMTRTLNYLVGF